MLRVGRDRMTDRGNVRGFEYVQCNAESLPFPDARFDVVSIAFGLRNVTHKDAALREMKRVLKPGGRVIVLEFSRVAKPLEKIYDLYSFKLLPLMQTNFIETNPIPVKRAMKLLGFCSDELRLPLCPMQPENEKKLVAAMKAPSVVEKLTPFGIVVSTSKSPEDFGKLIDSEAAWMSAISKKIELTNN